MISPIAFHILGWPIYWYGISYIISFLVGRYILLKTSNYSKQLIDKLINLLIIGCITGGRIGYVVFYDLTNCLKNPIDIFKIYNGGMSFHGGVIGFLISGYIFSKKNELPFLKIADFVSIAATPGIFLVRIANFINQEHFGRIVQNESIANIIGITYEKACDSMLRYPSQIFEGVFEGIFVGIILFQILKKHYKFEGIIFSYFCIFSSITRFVVEFIREPDGYIWILTIGQFISIPLLAVGLVCIFICKNRYSNNYKYKGYHSN